MNLRVVFIITAFLALGPAAWAVLTPDTLSSSGKLSCCGWEITP